MKEGTKGVAVIFLAYVMWGAMPVYWRAMSSIGSLEILAHRAIWSFVFTFILLLVGRGFGDVASLLRSNPRALPILAISSATITANWGLYIWAVNSGRILDTSLGYFINPLVSILLGLVVFRERLNRAQTLAIAAAVCGVSAEVVVLGRIPLVSLALAFTFGLYSLFKKLFAVAPITGMMVETAFMTPFALIWLLWRQSAGTASYPYALGLDLLLAGTGIFTALPLIIFAWGVSRTTMIMLGLIQYTSPIMTFLTATLVYHEPMPLGRVLSFSFIWLGIMIYTIDSLWLSKRQKNA
jgi:chloramphenicol-sensitive protein RarD